MSFTPQRSLAAHVSGIGVYKNSSPASVVLKDKLFLFYLGSGDDGIFFTTTPDGNNWAGIKNITDEATNMGVAVNTSPSPVVFKDTIYLFYNGRGNDGTYYTTFAGSQWSQAISVSERAGGIGFLPSTSPSAAVYDSKLYLFWNGRGDDGIFYTVSTDGTNWARQDKVKNIGIAKATSPCAIPFNGSLYLFWNGRGDDGTWYSTYSNGSWTSQNSVEAQIGGMGFLSGTSPAALVLGDGFTMRLFWVGSGGSDQGAWYSDFNTKTWIPQQNMSVDIGGQGLLPSTNPCAVEFQLTPYVFWVGYNQDLWLSSGITYDLSAADWFGPSECFRLGKSFTITSRDYALASFFKARLGDGMTIPPQAPSDTDSALVAKVFKEWNVETYINMAYQVVRFVYVCTFRAGVAYLVIIRINPDIPGMFVLMLNVGINA